jgi:hypothetical protein
MFQDPCDYPTVNLLLCGTSCAVPYFYFLYGGLPGIFLSIVPNAIDFCVERTKRESSLDITYILYKKV